MFLAAAEFWKNLPPQISAFILGAVFTSLLYRVRHVFLIPKITIVHDPKRKVCNPVTKSETKYIRVMVKNKGPVMATDCRVFLTKVTETWPNEEPRVLLEEPFRLDWSRERISAGEGLSVYRGINIPSGATFFADLCFSERDGPSTAWQMSLGGLEPKHRTEVAQDIFGKNKRLRFHLLCAADRTPAISLYVDIDTGGSWDSLRGVAPAKVSTPNWLCLFFQFFRC